MTVPEASMISGSLPPPLYLVDASIYIFRPYFSLPERWRSEDGYPTQAVYGYINFLLKLLEQASPEFIAAAFDESLGRCFRNDIYPDYKSNRVLPDEALAFQLNACAEATVLLGITGLGSSSHEADDIVGTLAKTGREQGHPIVILSGDKDLSQLVIAEGDAVWDFGRKDPLNREGVKEKLGIWPEQVPDYLALVGDAIDCIPGVPGIGAKTAIALLDHFPSIDHLLAAEPSQIARIPVRGAKGLSGKLEVYREQLLMALNLTSIADNAPVGPISVQRRPMDLEKLAGFFQRMGFARSLLVRAEQIDKKLCVTL
jgi:5'-3' exonuclease